MRLIARKPGSFCGKRFYIGEEIPEHFVICPEMQEKLGVLAIIKEGNPVDIADASVQEQIIDIAEKGKKNKTVKTNSKGANS